MVLKGWYNKFKWVDTKKLWIDLYLFSRGLKRCLKRVVFVLKNKKGSISSVNLSFECESVWEINFKCKLKMMKLVEIRWRGIFQV